MLSCRYLRTLLVGQLDGVSTMLNSVDKDESRLEEGMA